MQLCDVHASTTTTTFVAVHLARTAQKISRDEQRTFQRRVKSLSDAREEIKHMNSKLLWCDRQSDSFGATDW